LKLATVESCTGGLLAAYLTAVPGSSAVVERGFVTYSNDAKIENAGVEPHLIEQYGAVSAPVAEAMARGALERAPVDLTAAITGVAGPGGGTTAKPVGLVYIAVANKDGSVEVRENHLQGDRDAVRSASVQIALEMLTAMAESR
jgi:nicotinamide-nucleotide amidase